MQSITNLSDRDSRFKSPQPAARWRTILRLAKLARPVARCGGQRQASRQVAYALSTEPFTVRRDVCAVLAALAARGQVDLPRIGDIWEELDRLPRLDAVRVARPRLRQVERRDPLPVAAAKAMPLDTVLDRLGIDVRRRGRLVSACCPFHDDRHPSLNLDLRKGLWHCFVCSTGGDGIELVMKVRGLSFADAVREIAA